MSPSTRAATPRWRRAVWASLALAPLALLVSLASAGRPPVAERLDAALAALEPGRPYAWLEGFQRRFPGRWRGSDAHRAAPEAIAGALREAGVTDVRLERLQGHVNVVARVPGVDRGAEVVLAAHHDVVHGAPGAIDDGGAVAVLVEVAHALATSPPACDVLLIAFDGEEAGLLGSKAHVAALGEAGRARVRAAIAVELVGWTEDRLVVHTIPSGFAWESAGIVPAWLPSAVLAAGDAAGVPVGYGDSLVSPWYQGTIRVLGVRTGSDAGAYVEQGVPAVMLTGSALTNFYRHYHTAEDSLEQVDPDRLDDAARVALAATWSLAATPPQPRDFGDAYLILGGRPLGYAHLLALALLGALPALIACAAPRRGQRLTRTGLACLGVGVAALGICGSVLGVWVGVPLALGLAGATCARSGWSQRACVYLGLSVGLVQAALFVGAVATFGLRWRGGVAEPVLLGVLALGLALASTGAGSLAAGPAVRSGPRRAPSS